MLKRKHKILVERDPHDPFVSHLVVQLMPGTKAAISLLMACPVRVDRNDPIFTLQLDSDSSMQLCSPLACCLVDPNPEKELAGPGRYKLASLRQCDHEPKDQLAVWVCRHCGHDLPYFFEKEEKPLEFEGATFEVENGGLVFKEQKIAALDERQFSAPFSCKVVKIQSPTKIQVRKMVCGHESVSNFGLCNSCGQNPEIIGKKYLAFCEKGFLKPRIAEQLQLEMIASLKAQKRLILVLDLDHTILHSMQVQNDTPIDHIKECIVESIPNKEARIVIKFRPFLGEFLKSVLPAYDIFIYTAASRRYAELIFHEMHIRYKDFITPYQEHFAYERIMTRNDHQFPTKTLANIYPGQLQALTLILDDLPNAWDSPDCVVPTRPFTYFQFDKDNQLKQPVRPDNFLEKAAPFLLRVSTAFYSGEATCTKQIKKTLMAEVLDGQAVAFDSPMMKDIYAHVVAAMGGRLEQDQELAAYIIKDEKNGAKVESKASGKFAHPSKNKTRNWLLRLYYSFTRPEV